MSNFRMQVVNSKTGDIVQWRPGFPVEVDIVEDVCEKLSKRGVGLFRSQARVLQAVRECFAESLLELKKKV